MPPLQAAGFVLVMFGTAFIGGLIAHYGISADPVNSEAHIVAGLSGLFVAIGAFLMVAFGVQQR